LAKAIARSQRAQPIGSIALAQHADDQVETLLLALSRGAGLPGLSAMPATWLRDGVRYHRPLLRVAAQDVRTWLQNRNTHWLEDPTNTDERYTRNRIRAQLLPALARSLPAFRDTFARSAVHAAQAQQVLQDMAQQDLTAIGRPPQIAQLQQLSRARQANVLRHWLVCEFQQTPSSAQLGELLDQIQACTSAAHRIHIKLGSGFATRQGHFLGWYNLAPLPTHQSSQWL
jgi:tRNA(Ile)-lysidine synthase